MGRDDGEFLSLADEIAEELRTSPYPQGIGWDSSDPDKAYRKGYSVGRFPDRSAPPIASSRRSMQEFNTTEMYEMGVADGWGIDA